MRARLRVMSLLLLAITTACGNVTAPGDPDAGPPPDAGEPDAPLPRYALTVTVEGNGSVSSAPAGIACGDDCTETFEQGTQVVLVATEAEHAAFVGWTGGGCEGATPTCTVTMSEAKTVTAAFKTGYTLTVNKLGDGTGTVTSDPAGIDCGETCNHGYDAGTMVTLTAEHGPQSTFAGWGGDGDACPDNRATCTVEMSRALSVTATFAPRYVLTVRTQGAGTVTAKLADGTTSFTCAGNQTCTHEYDEGVEITLSVAASTGSAFKEWGEACSGNGTCKVTMTSAKTVTARFPRVLQLGVTVNVSANSGGYVSVRIPGREPEILRGASSYPVMEGDSVTLIAEGTTDAYSFVGWSGNTCSGTQQTCTFTMNQARSATATYREDYAFLAGAIMQSGSGRAHVRVFQSGVLVAACTSVQMYCDLRVNRGTVTISAVADECATFVGFYGMGDSSLVQVTAPGPEGAQLVALALFDGCR